MLAMMIRTINQSLMVELVMTMGIMAEFDMVEMMISHRMDRNWKTSYTLHVSMRR